jgi:hypothetical protein
MVRGNFHIARIRSSGSSTKQEFDMDRLPQCSTVRGVADMTAQQSARLIPGIEGPDIATNRLERSVP